MIQILFSTKQLHPWIDTLCLSGMSFADYTPLKKMQKFIAPKEFESEHPLK